MLTVARGDGRLRGIELEGDSLYTECKPDIHTNGGI
jgi:hypothetical protein